MERINSIDIRCRNKHCNKLFMVYHITVSDKILEMEGFELKCEKCKRVLRLRNYTEKMLLERAERGVFRV